MEELHFFSFNKQSDWAQGASYNLDSDGGVLTMRTTAKYTASRTFAFAEIFRVMDMSEHDDKERKPEVTHIAAERNGRVLLTDDLNQLWMYDPVNEYREMLFRQPHGLFGPDAALAAGEELLYVVDRTGDRRAAAYQLATGQCIWSVGERNGLPIEPSAVCTDHAENAYVLIAEYEQLHPFSRNQTAEPAPPIESSGEISRTPAHLKVLKIDSRGNISEPYASLSIEINREEPAGEPDDTLQALSSSNGSGLQGGTRFRIGCGKDGPPAVLDCLTGTVYMFAGDQVTAIKLELPTKVPAGFVVDSKGGLFIGDGRTLAPGQDDNRFIWRLEPGDSEPKLVGGFRGRCDQLSIDRKDRLFVLDGEAEMITILELKPRMMDLEPTGALRAMLFTKSLDSTLTETRWHKLLLDADIPDETQLRIRYFASDRKAFILEDDYRELDDYIGDETVPWQRKEKELEKYWSEPIVNPYDALLFRAEGQYIWLKIEFLASETKCPAIRKLRVYYPRSSFLSYLPAVYQEDKQSHDFLERFLSLFGTIYLGLEQQIDQVSSLIDVETVPADFLQWLAGWVGINEPYWSPDQLRELIRRAPELYRERGTKRGLAKMIALYTGEMPLIIEYFEYKSLLDRPEWSGLVSQLYGGSPYSFCVLVKQEHLENETKRYALQQIIESNKPAFAEPKLVVLEPWMQMDMHTYLGVNSVISEPAWQQLDDPSTKPDHTVLNDEEHNRQIDFHIRLDMDAELE